MEIQLSVVPPRCSRGRWPRPHQSFATRGTGCGQRPRLQPRSHRR